MWLGIVVGLPGIWLVSRERTQGASTRSGFGDGVLAGAGFGAMFVALGQIPERAGLLPVALNELVAGAAVVAVARVMSARWVPGRAALARAWSPACWPRAPR
ncbi:MAG: hypothetical protein R2734_10815 [Nocardioides sp.]